MRIMVLAGSLLLALGGNAMAAQVYKWVDAQGVTHFSAQPPQGQQAESVATPSASPAAPTPPARQPRDARDEQDLIDRKVRQEVAEQEAELRRYCETARTTLAQLQNNPRLRVEENGQARRLGEEERQARIAQAQQNIKEHCN